MYLNHPTSDHVGMKLKTEVDCKNKPPTKLMLKTFLQFLFSDWWSELESIVVGMALIHWHNVP